MSFVLSFLAVLLPLTLSPGPATIALAGQGMAGGVARSMPFYFGLLISTAIITIVCGFGLSGIILANPTLFKILQIAGIAYIVYLGTKLIRARPTAGATVANPYSFVNGLTLSFLNPKLFVMMLALFSQFVEAPGDIKYVVGLFILVIAFSQAVWLLIGVFLHAFLKSGRMLERMTTVFGVLLIAMSIYLLVRL